MKFSIQWTDGQGDIREVCQLTFDPTRFEVQQAEEAINSMIAGLEATSTLGTYFFLGA